MISSTNGTISRPNNVGVVSRIGANDLLPLESNEGFR